MLSNSRKKNRGASAKSEHEQAEETKKLYKVESIASNLTHEGHVYLDVPITWCVVRRDPPIPRHKASLNYEIPHREKFFEPFTHSQAQMFQAYLIAIHGDLAVVKEIKSIEEITPVGSIPHLFKIHEEPEYNLTFRVEGYYWADDVNVPF